MVDFRKARTPLIKGVSQFQVDFVIPRLGIDLPLGIDPFLLFKSRDNDFHALHDLVVGVFNRAIRLIADGHIDRARELFQFPEAWEIGFGYSEKSGKRGSGLGDYLSELLVATIADSPELLKGGIRHIEEFQLLTPGIGRDRISDITANLLKRYLIDYTAKQCKIWNIPVTTQVPVSHIFDPHAYEWHDDFVDLPISQVDGQAMLFVPRRIVRTLPWINYGDFFRSEFSAYLRAKQVKKRIRQKTDDSAMREEVAKPEVTAALRKDLQQVHKYIRYKEETAREAQPTLGYLNLEATCDESEQLKAALAAMPSGLAHASAYQHLILEILNFLFNPELIDGELEVRTVEGTERRDIIFTNDSDQTFWEYIRNEHSTILLMFETKNTAAIEIAHINQTAAYLGDRLGRLGIIVSRNSLVEPQRKKVQAIYNDASPRKIILALSDLDVFAMLDMKCAGHDPMRYVQKLYRTFRTSVQ